MREVIAVGYPPLPCRASPPQGGRLDVALFRPTLMLLIKREACFLPISPLVGEMPGRAEGGEAKPHRQEACHAL